jgi:hypothetical protein
VLATYLLGAGASANALPVGFGMEEALSFVQDEFIRAIEDESASNEFSGEGMDDMKAGSKGFIGRLEWAKSIAHRFGTFDTYARRCYLSQLSLKHQRLPRSFR